MKLDSQMKEQLKEVFNKLDAPVDLLYDHSQHPKQKELMEMLSSLQETSPYLNLWESAQSSDVPRFSIATNSQPNGVHFVGIPGGHEFTSLVLAILNSNLKGKLPDEHIINKMKNLKGPIDLKTYISLSCENCPDVVQTLNLIAIFNPEFTHTMVDGELAQDEIEKLKIQGVPSVVSGDKLVSVGKTSLSELLQKLETTFGTQNIQTQSKDLGQFDVVVIGGGPGGASSAIYAARKGLATAIIAERFGGQVQDTKGIENLISLPYIEGPELTQKLLSHMDEYPIKRLEHRRVEQVENKELKKITLDSGEVLTTKSLIIATGAKWKELGVSGEKEYLGRGVAFCPHCDGPYYKGKDIAVIGGGNSGVEAAIDLAGIVKSVTLFEFAPELKADQVLIDKLNSLSNVNIITNAQTTEILGEKGKVNRLEYKNRESGELVKHPIDGVFIQIGLVPNSAFLKGHVETNKFGEIIVDVKGKTSQKGIFAAGDVTDTPYKQIITSMGDGAKAALSAFEELMLA